MPHFPSVGLVNNVVLSTASPESIGRDINAMGLSAASATSVANKAFFVPIVIYQPLLIVKMFVENGTAVAGNVDAGIYYANGTRVVSSGSTLQSGTSAIQQLEITDTVIEPGFYYLASVYSNVTGTSFRWSPSSSQVIARGMGVVEQSSAFPLPALASFAVISSNVIPAIYATTRSVI